MTKKFKRVLSDEWLPLEFKSGNEIPVFSKMVDRKSLRSIVEQAEQAVLAKLAEQEPVSWLIPEGYGSRMTLKEDEAKFLKDVWKLDIKPLYILPTYNQGASNDYTSR